MHPALVKNSVVAKKNPTVFPSEKTSKNDFVYWLYRQISSVLLVLMSFPLSIFVGYVVCQPTQLSIFALSLESIRILEKQ